MLSEEIVLVKQSSAIFRLSMIKDFTWDVNAQLRKMGIHEDLKNNS